MATETLKYSTTDLHLQILQRAVEAGDVELVHDVFPANEVEVRVVLTFDLEADTPAKHIIEAADSFVQDAVSVAVGCIDLDYAHVEEVSFFSANVKAR